jgi:UDPglucose--hexose-1-phosphate uridylyltransferase
VPEFRRDPVVGRWVIISTDRIQRPTDFLAHHTSLPVLPLCPFCPGNEAQTPPEILAYREPATSANSPGWNVRVVPNKFPALQIEGDLGREGVGLYDRMNGVGAHEVIIETPDHKETLATLPEKRVEDLFWAYRDRILDLRKDLRLRYVLIFKNHGPAAGATLEHPHSQLIALPIVPTNVTVEIEGCREHYQNKERCIYCDIIRQESGDRTRVVTENGEFLSIVPFAPRFPFEIWILPKRHASCFEQIQKFEVEGLARIFSDTLRRLDRVLAVPPFNFILHTSPLHEQAGDFYHWHIEIIPKLTQIAGFEWGTGFYINPVLPEEAAVFLRNAEI